MKTTAKRFCKTLLPLFLAVTMVAGLLVGCAGKKDYTKGGGANGDYFAPAEEAGAELYSKANPDKDNAEEPSDAFVENSFIDTARQNVSTFSADVDTASYALFRKTVTGWVRQKANKQTILSALEKNASSFRTEEFLNYFRYEANAPKDGELFGTTVGILPCPWNPKNQLLRLTLQAPAKSGHSFDGWYDNAECTGDALSEISATETGNKTFYAKWTPIPYTVSWDANGGTLTGSYTSGTVDYGTAITAPTATQKG